MNSAIRSRLVGRVAGALLVSTLVAACGAATPSPSPSLTMPSASPAAAVASVGPTFTAPPTPSPTPSPTPLPTPSPSPTPFSVVAATSCDPSVVPGAAYPPAAPARSPNATPVTLHVPILEYHRIVPPAQAGKSVAGLTMTPQVFDAQMAALAKAGWHTITLATLADDLAANVTPPSHTFVVTIDDGWWDSYNYAFNILLKYGFVATFFVIADRIGQPSFLAANEIQILVAAGNDIGDHTVNHNALTAAQPKALTYEIDSAAATIAAITGRWPETLAYPLGETDSRVMAAVAACKPLRLAVVEGSGGQETWATRFRVSRIQVGSQRLPADLLAQVQRVGR